MKRAALPSTLGVLLILSTHHILVQASSLEASFYDIKLHPLA